MCSALNASRRTFCRGLGARVLASIRIAGGCSGHLAVTHKRRIITRAKVPYYDLFLILIIKPLKHIELLISLIYHLNNSYIRNQLDPVYNVHPFPLETKPEVPETPEEPPKRCICARCLQSVDDKNKVEIGGQCFHPQCAKCCKYLPLEISSRYFHQVIIIGLPKMTMFTNFVKLKRLPIRLHRNARSVPPVCALLFL